ncbi:MAG: Y-family DNA polymerase [Bacteroidales bacterium]|nr:Y-family DNA polymerase [Candidatus Cacconaster merdequi]
MFALADCNNFFVSCERVFRPDLNGKPVIVLSNNDGCAVARSNEAKALGIKMGAPFFKIKDIVRKNGVTVFSGNMALYSDMSRRVKSVLRASAPAMEVYSIDEAFLNLEGMDIDFDRYAKELSARCFRWTGIPVSVGVAPTKTLAKIASKLCKQYPKLKGGCYMHRLQDIEKVLRKFPVDDVWGIGRKTFAKLQSMNVVTAWDYASLSQSQVNRLFGLPGLNTWKELNGIPTIEFEDAVRSKQSISNTRSFSKEITDVEALCEQVALFATMTAEKLRQQGSVCYELAVFAMTNRFKEYVRQSISNDIVFFRTPTSSTSEIVASAVKSVRQFFRADCAYKRAGVTALKIVPESSVMPMLFDDADAREKDKGLMKVLDQVNAVYGRGTIRMGICSDKVSSNSALRSPQYSTLPSDFPVVKG